MRKVRAPTKQVQTVQAGIGGFIDELTRFHHDHFSVDTQVVAQLGLEFNSYQAGFRQVSAEDITVVDCGIEAIGITGFGQKRLGSINIELIPGIADTAVGEAAGGEVRGNCCAICIEIVYDALGSIPIAIA
jgi:hypothetical protein